MIDFPALFPSLVKYLPNWMERFYPSLAQFARGEGYPCGNKGVFIPRRNKCWTHPKTGNRLTKPLTYQKYQEAKEKSQKSRTEAGRTALQNREQSFRDKAREKVKGWQNKAKEAESGTDSKLALTWDNLDDRYKIELLNKSGLKVKALERKKYWEGNLNNTLSLIQDSKVKESLTKALEDPKYQEDFFSKNKPPIEKNPPKTALEVYRERYKDVDDNFIENEIKNLRKRASNLFEQGKDEMSGGRRSTRKAVAGHGGWMLTNNANDLEELLEYRRKTKKTPQTETKPTPDKKVEQKYKDIIASSKNPKATEEAISEALADTLGFEKQTYERYLTAQKDGTVPKGREEYYQKHIDQYKPVIESEQFLKERRQKAIDGDFETEAEVRPYMQAMGKKYGKDYDYYDSPEYVQKREKLKSIVGEDPLPPVLSGKIPGKELRQTLKPGDKLLKKEVTYGYAGSLAGGSTPTGWKYRDGGEVTKVAIKNVTTKKDYGGDGKFYDDSIPMRDVTHVIRDGKRYKVDDSDNTPNGLGIPESVKPKAKKRVKKNDFNSNLTLTNFGNSTLRRRKTKTANFAKGEGYPCGNNGVFIPRRNKCWKHPKTGQRMTKPLTYQKYQEAKEKSQRSRTEAGKTALANREQSFRDKAREKVKGWQNKTSEVEANPRSTIDILSIDKPIGLDEAKEVIGRLNTGDITAKEAKSHYERIKNSGVLVKQELNKLNKNQLKEGYKGSLWSDAKKDELVDKVYTSMLKSFNLSGSLSIGIGAGDKGVIKAIDQAVESSLTDKNIQAFAVKDNKKTEAIKAEVSSTLLKGIEKVKFDPKIEQKYQEIIAKTKSPKEAESVLLSALTDDTSWQTQKNRANKFDRMMKANYVPDGKKGFFQRVIDEHKPYADAEGFIDERRKAISNGEYQNSVEAKAYISKKIKDFDYDEYKYYDSPKYREDYDNLQLQITDNKLPPPVSGSILKSNLGEALKPGDKLLIKEPIRDKGGRNIGFKGTENGEVLKAMGKTAQVRMTDKNKFVENWEDRVSLDSVSHVIRNGKRYKVDGSDSAYNQTAEKIRITRKDFNSNLTLANFGNNNIRRRKSKLANFSKPGCSCDASKPLRRRKTKLTPRSKRKGAYA